MSTLPVTSFYAAIFGLLVIPFAMRVGFARIDSKIYFLDGGNQTLLRRMRAHGNFIETVPFAIILMALAEFNGASAAYMHATGMTLLIARIMHYITLQTNPIGIGRAVGMLGTFAAYLASCGYLLYSFV